MAFVIADRVRETTTTTGTGTITLGGAATGFQTFSAAIGNSNSTYYCITDSATGDWEVGIGTYTSSGNTLSRDTILSSSNSGSVVPFSAGSKDVFVTQPAERAVYVNGTDIIAENNASLKAAYGGTGLTSPGASGNVLTSNGTIWTSAALPAGGLTYVVKTANYTAQDKEGVLADTSGGAFTVTLPATPAVGAQVVVADAAGTWGTNNLTVGRNGSNIAGSATDLVCDISGVSVQLVYDGSSWEVYAQVGGNGGTTVSTGKVIAMAMVFGG